MLSPFQQHLGTNFVPSTLEFDDIQRILHETSQEVRTIDVEIDKLSGQLNRLHERRSRVCNFIDQHRALISPIRSISEEVLEEIFLACLPQDRNSCIVATEAPLLLTHVCRLWRSVALSLPRLWSSIHIALPTYLPEVYGMAWTSSEFSLQEELLSQKLEELKSIVDEWLLRCRECQPSISIFRRRANFSGNVSNISVVQERENRLHVSFVTYILRSRLHCWHKVDLCLSQMFIVGLFDDETMDYRMPALRHFHLHSMNLKAANIIRFINPGLVSLSLRGCHLKKSDLSHIPRSVWRQLKSLDFDIQLSGDPRFPEMPDIAHSVFLMCQSLETLKLHIIDRINYGRNATPKPNQIKPIILPKLTAFSLDQPVISLEVARFLVKLQLPELKELKLPLPLSNADELMETIFRYSGRSLTSLGFCCDSGRHPMSHPHDFRSVLQYLRMAPNLTCFKLSSSCMFAAEYRWILPAPFQDTYNIDARILVGDDIINALSPSGKDYSDIVCPKLQVFDCDREFITGISSTALRECIKARQSAHILDFRIAPLETVRVFIDEHRRTEGEEVSLRKDSAVYFRKRLVEKRLLYSPLDGFVPEVKNYIPGDQPFFSDAYTDL